MAFSEIYQPYNSNIHAGRKLMKLNSSKNYALITGVLLFCLGFFGFAFRDSFNLPDIYLLGALVLGFWGVIVGVGRNRQA